MRIAVLGATGMAGSAVVTEALGRGHAVTGVSRTPAPVDPGSRLTPRALDVAETGALPPVLAEADAAVLSIRLAPGAEHRLAPLSEGVLDAAAEAGTRVIVVGGSAPLRSPDDPGTLVIDTDYVPDAYRSLAQASLAQYRACRSHPYGGWVYLSPPAVLEPGARTGRYRRGTSTLLVDEAGGSRIAAGDLAIAVLDELEKPSGEQHLTVAG